MSWGDDEGYRGECAACGRKTWIESGCAPVCDGCEMPEDEDEEESE